MIHVEQRLFYNAETGERGDCIKCCLASLLELGYDDVPHFAGMGDRWHVEMTEWLAERNWLLGNAFWTADEDDPGRLCGYSQGYWLAGVYSLRTKQDGEPIHHMIVMLGADCVWDPHPDRVQGHQGFNDGWRLVPFDPGRFVLRPAEPPAEAEPEVEA